MCLYLSQLDLELLLWYEKYESVCFFLNYVHVLPASSPHEALGRLGLRVCDKMASKRLAIGLIGPGLVGKALLEQLGQQVCYL